MSILSADIVLLKIMMNGSILIIGSLLWDNGKREEWRNSRLCIEEKVFVRAPIRYGRRSSSRGNTFTMTLSPDDLTGRAVLVPCKAAIADVPALISEAEALWKAERHTASPGEIGSSWGCVGVLFRAGAELTGWLQPWTDYFGANAYAISPVGENGALQIPWPTTTIEGAPADADVILATATKAEATRLSVEDIADAWLSQNNGYERYFFENVRHGIRTPDDSLIWRKIKERSPHWLGKSSYGEAIALLEREASERP